MLPLPVKVKSLVTRVESLLDSSALLIRQSGALANSKEEYFLVRILFVQVIAVVAITNFMLSVTRRISIYD